MFKISPSILACDFANLEAEVSAMQRAGVEMVHVDVMDGHFVPNISIGLPVVASLRKKTALPLDVHLMISDPLTYAPQFCDMGADIVTFHVESESDPQAVIDAIRAKGKKCGMTIKPRTPAEALFPYLSQLDMVLVMTVEPGFGGQSFMPEMMPKVKEIKRECQRRGLNNILIEADGGIGRDTIEQASEAGVDVCVAGTAVFRAADPAKAIELFKSF